MSATQMGAFVYYDREPFKITYYTGNGGGTGVDANLDRWRSEFKAFGTIEDVQALQLALADSDYGQPAAQTASDLGLTSELGRALAFDIHVQNGGIKPAARKDIDAALEEMPSPTEQEVRVIIANAVADASATSFKEDVRARKLTIATGAGRVHGETFVLSNWGLDETLADAG
jgi:hypothetical protein